MSGAAIKAVVMRHPAERMAVEEVRLREVGPDDVRVRVVVTAVCHSDHSLARGTLKQPVPAVLGHEASGVVEEVGAAVDDLASGDRVLILWNAPCGECFHCLRDEAHLCLDAPARGGVPHATDPEGHHVYPGLAVGTFAEQTVVPRRAVLPLPDDISFEAASLLGCAVVTGVGAILNTAQVAEGDSVVVIGLGGVGLSAVQGARIARASTIIAVDRNDRKADVALAVGATHFLPADDNLKTAVREIVGRAGADHAVDCVGNSRTIRSAWSLARRGGAVTVVGIGAGNDMVEFSALELFHFARTLRGCFAGSVNPLRDMPKFFEMVRTNELKLDPLMSARGGLGDVEAALDQQVSGDGVRTLIYPDA